VAKKTKEEMERWLDREKKYRYHQAYSGNRNEDARGKYPLNIAIQQNIRRFKALCVKDEKEVQKIKARYVKALEKMNG
jgi:hypothetical protein